MRRLVLGSLVACVVGGFATSFYAAYLQWWVYPEMTRPQFFWAQWPWFVVCCLFWAAALLLFEVAVRRRW